MLENCPNITSVNFSGCDGYGQYRVKVSEGIYGKFEDFKALGALLQLSIRGCFKIDCKKALEVLPTMPWAAQIQKLDLSFTDVEGTAECSFVFGVPVRNS